MRGTFVTLLTLQDNDGKSWVINRSTPGYIPSMLTLGVNMLRNHELAREVVLMLYGIEKYG